MGAGVRASSRISTTGHFCTCLMPGPPSASLHWCVFYSNSIPPPPYLDWTHIVMETIWSPLDFLATKTSYLIQYIQALALHNCWDLNHTVSGVTKGWHPWIGRVVLIVDHSSEEFNGGVTLWSLHNYLLWMAWESDPRCLNLIHKAPISGSTCCSAYNLNTCHFNGLVGCLSLIVIDFVKKKIQFTLTFWFQAILVVSGMPWFTNNYKAIKKTSEKLFEAIKV